MVLVHGSGKHPRNDLRKEAEAFARQGIVTLIYDKRTVGYSKNHRDFGLLADDAIAALKVLRSRPEVDPARAGLWGVSEGASWVLPVAATRSSDVKFLVLIAATGLSPARQIAWDVGNRLSHAGVSGAMLDRLPGGYTRLIVGGGFVQMADFSPTGPLAQLDQPVLAVWGAKDQLSPPFEGSRNTREALERGGNTHYTIRFFPDTNHMMRLSSDGFSKGSEFPAGYPELIGSWLRDLAAGPPAASADPAPPQPRLSREILPLAWYEQTWLQLGLIVVLLIAFAGGLVGRRNLPVARWTAASGLLTVLGFLTYLVYLFRAEMEKVGPVIADRAVYWLALQALAAATVVLGGVTAVRWWRSRAAGLRARLRIGGLLGGCVLVVPWALYWGLLLP